jgi:glycerophosphoryl diester phosphodiesterase
VVRRVIGTIATRAAQCVVISFDFDAVAHARTLGHARIGWVLSDMRTRSRDAAAGLEPEFLFVDHKKLPRSGPLWPGAWQWVVYEVATMPLARGLAQRGVQFIETMAVQKMMKAV